MLSDLFDYIFVLIDKRNLIFGVVLPSFALALATTLVSWIKIKLGPRYEFFLRLGSLILAALVFFWVTFLAWRDERTASREEAKKSQSAQQDQAAALECRFADMPKLPPPSGSIFIMEIGLPADRRLGFAERYALPESHPWAWPDDSRSYRCDVTNLGNKPMQNLLLPLKVSYRGNYSNRGPMDPPSTSEEEGALKDPEQTRWLRLPFLLAGSMFTFYVHSSEGAEATVDLPDNAQLGMDLSNSVAIKIVFGATRDLYFPPSAKRRRR